VNEQEKNWPIVKPAGRGVKFGKPRRLISAQAGVTYGGANFAKIVFAQKSFVSWLLEREAVKTSACAELDEVGA
jgi:hypothetical protein